MQISADITLYPLDSAYRDRVNHFLERLQSRPGLRIQVGAMSTIVSGEYGALMRALEEDCGAVFEEGAAAFVIKLSNACPT